MCRLYLSFKGFKLPWSFPTHNPYSISLSPSLSLSLSISLSLSQSLSSSLCWDPAGLTFYYSLVPSQLNLMVSISSPLWPLMSL